jgi:hypothetical protein
MTLKPWVLTVSIGALVSGVGAWLLERYGALASVQTVSFAVFYASIGLAVLAGVLSAVRAGRLRRPGWSARLALMTAGGVVSWWSAVVLALRYYFSSTPANMRPLFDALLFAPQVVLSVAALLSVFQLRSGHPAPTQPPTRTP